MSCHGRVDSIQWPIRAKMAQFGMGSVLRWNLEKRIVIECSTMYAYVMNGGLAQHCGPVLAPLSTNHRATKTRPACQSCRMRFSGAGEEI